MLGRTIIFDDPGPRRAATSAATAMLPMLLLRYLRRPTARRMVSVRPTSFNPLSVANLITSATSSLFGTASLAGDAVGVFSVDRFERRGAAGLLLGRSCWRAKPFRALRGQAPLCRELPLLSASVRSFASAALPLPSPASRHTASASSWLRRASFRRRPASSSRASLEALASTTGEHLLEMPSRELQPSDVREVALAERPGPPGSRILPIQVLRRQIGRDAQAKPVPVRRHRRKVSGCNSVAAKRHPFDRVLEPNFSFTQRPADVGFCFATRKARSR